MSTPPDIPYLTFRRFLVETYGAPLYRVAIDAGLGCPHRAASGTGCAFCAEDGGRAVYLDEVETIEDQIERGLAFARQRYGATKFMAYVQAFTGTNAPPEHLQALFDRILAAYPFEALSVGTRPDCLPEPVLDILSDFRTRTDVWVELGVQTIHDVTLTRIHRGHDWAASREAILELARRSIRVAAHVILGLPGETPRDWQATAEALAALPLSGVKIHNLHVIRGTPLAETFHRAPFPVPDEEAYAAGVMEFLRRTPPGVPILRISTDTNPARLLAPCWTLAKGQFRDLVVNTMRANGWRQGDRVERKEPVR